MTPKTDYLLDTNICIYILEGASDRVASRLEQCDIGSVGVSSISYAEVMLGAVQLGDAAAAKSLFRKIGPLPFSKDAAEVYAALPFRRGSFDRLIAAHAIALDATLVTNNERDFRDIPGLKVENWTQ
jgi:tRNA(fMet)-specific endonuclease VapC